MVSVRDFAFTLIGNWDIENMRYACIEFITGSPNLNSFFIANTSYSSFRIIVKLYSFYTLSSLRMIINALLYGVEINQHSTMNVVMVTT